jgi:hypothetical protein
MSVCVQLDPRPTRYNVLTLTLTAMGRSAHTIFKGLKLKKSLNAKISYSTENIC